jgi:hypothetical protein
MTVLSGRPPVHWSKWQAIPGRWPAAAGCLAFGDAAAYLSPGPLAVRAIAHAAGVARRSSEVCVHPQADGGSAVRPREVGVLKSHRCAVRHADALREHGMQTPATGSTLRFTTSPGLEPDGCTEAWIRIV